jgi:hypothetical protein
MLALAAWLLGCASGPNIFVNADPAADLMGLRSFDFMEPLSTDRGEVRSLLSTQLVAATTDELEKRGMRLDQDDPDVLINFLLETQEQIRTRSTGASMSVHRSGRYGRWGGTMSTPTIEQVTEGQLSIDIIDPDRNQLIWEGTAVKRVPDNMRRNQEEEVRTFVAAILAEFPQSVTK